MKYIPFLIIALFVAGRCQADVAWDSYSNSQIVDAIWKAEGSEKATFAYGIRSVPYKDVAEARRICLNSVRNGRRRWEIGGKPYDLITHIGLRYCPPTAHAKNKFWTRNVKFFLRGARNER